jgi:hypothetical protein
MVNRLWVDGDADFRSQIAACVDAKGSCSCRLYDYETGSFVRKLPNRHGSFHASFADVLENAIAFSAPFQPDLVNTEKSGLPGEVLNSARQI